MIKWARRTVIECAGKADLWQCQVHDRGTLEQVEERDVCRAEHLEEAHELRERHVAQWVKRNGCALIVALDVAFTIFQTEKQTQYVSHCLVSP